MRKHRGAGSGVGRHIGTEGGGTDRVSGWWTATSISKFTFFTDELGESKAMNPLLPPFVSFRASIPTAPAPIPASVLLFKFWRLACVFVLDVHSEVFH